MIKNRMKDSKGVSLVSLVITVVVLVVLTNIIIYNAKDNLKIGNLKEMQNDISNLRDKVSFYYAQNGKIPAKMPYTNIEAIKNAGVISNAVDRGEFFVIDLSAFENLTLNRGKDFEKVKSYQELTDEQQKNFTDLYIINETSHNIFYVEGITMDEETFYTDYTAKDEEVDIDRVDLRYVNNVKIPEGFYYVGGTIDTGIVISDVQGDDLDNSKQGNQFVWVPVENYTEFIREEFGNQNNKFSDEGMQEGKYFEVKENGYTNQTEVQKMYKSVKENKGFYIARYEAGTTMKETGSGIRGQVVSKKNASPYNDIIWGNSMTDETGGAVEVARSMAEQNNYQNITTTLCYGVQWDAVMRWIHQNDTLKQYLVNSTGIGNHNSEAITLTGEKQENQIKNIYDMAGNIWEWTMEAYNTNSRVYRGGGYTYTGEEYPITSRSQRDPLGKLNDIGFRVAFFLNEEYDKWSPAYDKEGIYKDKNGDTAYIPQGFQVSEKKGENIIDEGLVVRDSNQNEWVWIEVPRTTKVYSTAEMNITDFTDEEYNKIEKDLQTYTKDYKVGTSYCDEYYSEAQHGFIDANDYNNHKKSMLKSIYQNGGFYIGRYEVGATSYVSNDDNGARQAIIKQDAYPYNYTTCKKAQELSEGLATGGKTSSLMFGLQWDLVLKYIEERGMKLGETKEERKSKMIKTTYDLISTDWGNYKNADFTIERGKYAIYKEGASKLEEWESVNNTEKSENMAILLTAGATKRNSVLNIYDLAGNQYEWTLEYSGNTSRPCAFRSGSFNNNGSTHSASERFCGPYPSDSGMNLGFRSVLW